METSDTLVVNFFGGPGCGKSTLAYELVGKLKRNDFKAELVVEHAKWLTYSHNMRELNNQVCLLSQDNYRIELLCNQVDIVVLDGSMLNTLAYGTDELSRKLAVELYNQYNNIGYVLPRKQAYIKYGRKESKEQAEALDKVIFNSIQFLPEDERRDLRTEAPDTLVEFVYEDVVKAHKGSSISLRGDNR